MHRNYPIVILSLILLYVPCSVLAQAMANPYGRPVSLETAKKAAAGAAGEAKKNNFTMAIAVVDAGGVLVYFEKIDDTQNASADMAIAKARTANAYKRPTRLFEEGLASGRYGLLSLPNALLIEGGLPIIVDGKISGAIGVSGGSAQQDGQVAAAGVAALRSQ